LLFNCDDCDFGDEAMFVDVQLRGKNQKVRTAEKQDDGKSD